MIFNDEARSHNYDHAKENLAEHARNATNASEDLIRLALPSTTAYASPSHNFDHSSHPLLVADRARRYWEHLLQTLHQSSPLQVTLASLLSIPEAVLQLEALTSSVMSIESLDDLLHQLQSLHIQTTPHDQPYTEFDCLQTALQCMLKTLTNSFDAIEALSNPGNMTDSVSFKAALDQSLAAFTRIGAVITSILRLTGHLSDLLVGAEDSNNALIEASGASFESLERCIVLSTNLMGAALRIPPEYDIRNTLVHYSRGQNYEGHADYNSYREGFSMSNRFAVVSYLSSILSAAASIGTDRRVDGVAAVPVYIVSKYPKMTVSVLMSFELALQYASVDVAKMTDSLELPSLLAAVFAVYTCTGNLPLFGAVSPTSSDPSPDICSAILGALAAQCSIDRYWSNASPVPVWGDSHSTQPVDLEVVADRQATYHCGMLEIYEAITNGSGGGSEALTILCATVVTSGTSVEAISEAGDGFKALVILSCILTCLEPNKAAGFVSRIYDCCGSGLEEALLRPIGLICNYLSSGDTQHKESPRFVEYFIMSLTILNHCVKYNRVFPSTQIDMANFCLQTINQDDRGIEIGKFLYVKSQCYEVLICILEHTQSDDVKSFIRENVSTYTSILYSIDTVPADQVSTHYRPLVGDNVHPSSHLTVTALSFPLPEDSLNTVSYDISSPYGIQTSSLYDSTLLWHLHTTHIWPSLYSPADQERLITDILTMILTPVSLLHCYMLYSHISNFTQLSVFSCH